MLFQCLLWVTVRKGSLKLITADGKARVYGDTTPPHITIKLHNKKLEWSLGLNPHLKIGEAYVNGTLTIEEGDLYNLLHLLLTNYDATGDKSPFHWPEHFDRFFTWLGRLNTPHRAQNNIEFHYDMPDKLYSFFLDPDRQYSCGYFTDMSNSLGEAQLDKKRHIAAKLLLDGIGLNILDIGSGWGGLGLYLAREANCQVKGVTLSVNQYKISQERAAMMGLTKSCQFALQDYRQESGPYDRIVSVGMFEHVGKRNYNEFFTHVRRLLADDGVCLLHSIGRYGVPCPVNPFIRKHIFPGSYLPTLSEVMESIDRCGLFTTDVEILRLHYAETLHRWIKRIHQHRDEIVRLFGEPLYRKWEFYFISCELGFRLGYLMVFQIQLCKQLDAVPLTRDYMAEWEQTHKSEHPHSRRASLKEI
ncbi:MAG: cyclopropane-fatty-acyl-phospholipid synthase [Alphaproteobacteria bacterium]|nr:cyclopropane-fatty-acyl-phospholipid synthase [Alphaproteobacteria bacterium]